MSLRFDSAAEHVRLMLGAVQTNTAVRTMNRRQLLVGAGSIGVTTIGLSALSGSAAAQAEVGISAADTTVESDDGTTDHDPDSGSSGGGHGGSGGSGGSDDDDDDSPPPPETSVTGESNAAAE